MKTRRILRVLKFVLLGTLAAGVLSFVVMSLWNWLMPALFGWHVVTFWQALGLLVLSKLFFGGFRGRSGPPTAHVLAAAHDGALGTDDARGAGKIPRKFERLRAVRLAEGGV